VVGEGGSLMVRNMLALDSVLGAALAGLIGGLLLGYQWGQPAGWRTGIEP